MSTGIKPPFFADWWTLDRRVVRRSSNGRGASLPHVTERIWMNRPLVAEGTLFAETSGSGCAETPRSPRANGSDRGAET